MEQYCYDITGDKYNVDELKKYIEELYRKRSKKKYEKERRPTFRRSLFERIQSGMYQDDECSQETQGEDRRDS